MPYTYEELKAAGWNDKQIEAIRQFFGSSEHEQECRDNLRVARYSNADEINRYNDQQNRGCCGFCDQEVVVDNEIIYVGYNYGH